MKEHFLATEPAHPGGGQQAAALLGIKDIQQRHVRHSGRDGSAPQRDQNSTRLNERARRDSNP
jgi:hypothetical protein